MKALKFILYTCLFFLIGELLVRIDIRYDLLNNAPEKIAVEIEESDLLESVKSGRFVADSGQFRILVIGDSYIHGGGINPTDKFSKKLDGLLNNDSQSEHDYVILDVSVPRNNTLDNYNSFHYYYERFQPHLVFWAYTYNDILGRVKLPEQHQGSSEPINEPPKQALRERKGLDKIVKRVYSNSKLTLYLSENIQKELKTMGIVPPVGDFYNLTQKAYLATSKNWQESQRIFSRVLATCEAGQSQLFIYQMPEFNLLHKPELFSVADEAVYLYMERANGIHYVKGDTEFKGLDGNEYKISKYDGHPNAKAHALIADRVADYIKNNQ